jgi:flavodoxin
MSKILIAFFSLAGETYVNGRIENRQVGNTEVIARKLQDKIGGDMFHIETVVSYPHDHYEIIDKAKEELHTNDRPEIKGSVEDMDRYETIILGYPNWWGTMPMAVKTFLEGYDFGGKTIIPYCTHEGSGMGHSESDLKKLCPDSKILNGTAIHGADVQFADREANQIVNLAN